MLTALQLDTIKKASFHDAVAILTQQYPKQVVFSTSLGQEDQIITHEIFKRNLAVNIFTLDTGRLFSDTYELLALTQAHYKQKIDVYFPDTKEVEEYVAESGINGFYQSVEDRKRCCGIRKVNVLNRALKKAKVWITGLRAEQSENRKDMEIIEWDAERECYKYNPLIRWTYEAVLAFIEKENIPENGLHKKGFVSIGCAPCTRAIVKGEDPRNGRWWWESSQKECGLH